MTRTRLPPLRVVDRRDAPGLASLYLARLGDDPARSVEFVDTLEPGVPKSKKWVMMISTQVGCPVGCRMCDAGTLGYLGNLDAPQMLAQVAHMLRANPGLDVRSHPKVKIHFARMGEPSLNPAVIEALELLAREFPHPGVIPSISTVAPLSPAIDPFFERLKAVKDRHYPDGRFQLQFSLHSTDEAKRTEIVPIRKWPLEQVAAYGERFRRPGDRKITLNFALSRGETIDARKLERIFPAAAFLIKITPINPTETASARGHDYAWDRTPRTIRAAAKELEAAGFEVILSPSLPEEIQAETSCGQLWSSSLKGKARVLLKNRKREEASYVTRGTLPEKAREWERRVARFRRRSLPLRPEKSGLLVVDMQQLFLDPGSPSYLPAARAVLGTAAALVRSFRTAGRPVYFSRHAHENPDKDGGLMTLWWRQVCRAGTSGAEIARVLEPEEGRVFRKCRYNAFTNSALEPALRRDGVEDLAVCGVATNLCVESTVRAAFDKSFKTFVVLDASAARDEELHLSALRNLAHGFSTLLTAAEAADMLKETAPHEKDSARAV